MALIQLPLTLHYRRRIFNDQHYISPTSSGADLLSKRVDRRCWVRHPVAFVDLGIFSGFLGSSRKYGLGSLKKTSNKRHTTYNPQVPEEEYST